MKYYFITIVLLYHLCVHAQVTVTVDPTRTIKTLNGKENGINLNYLTDDAFTGNRGTTTAALKQMGIKMIRYPGGEKSDNYFFSAYPWDASSPRMASKDTRGWPNSDSRFVDIRSKEKLCRSLVLDFDEMVQMAKEIEAEPLIVVAYDIMYLNYSSGDPAIRPSKNELIEHAVEWVRYANIKKRYGIKYWMIGNESWNNPDYNGRTTPEQYSIDIVEFAKAMKTIDPSIKIIANGEKSWWPVLLKSAAVSWIDILAFSNYPTWNYKGGYSYYKNNNVNLTSELDEAIKAINYYAPNKDKDRLTILPSEFNSIDWSGSWANENDLGHALSNFQMFGDMILKPKVEAMCLWNTRWTEILNHPQSINDAIDKDGKLNANGAVQEVWGKNLLHKMVSASSTDVKVKSYASYDTINKALNIFILNKDSIAKSINVSLRNYVGSYGGSRWAFTGTDTGDKFPSYKWVEGISDPSNLSQITVSPTSITILKLFAPFGHLPLSIIYFKGEPKYDGVQLQWETAGEEDVVSFTVEKRKGADNFRIIGSLNAKGEAGIYKFFDADRYSDADYRLKMTFENSTNNFSKIISIKGNKSNLALKAAVMPNPVRTAITLQTASNNNRNVEIRIINNQGNLIMSRIKTIEKGESNLLIPETATIPSGQYWLQLIDGTSFSSIPFLKQ